MEVLAAGADKAHAHIEAGNEEDTRQQDAAHGAEQQAHHIGEGLRPVGRVGECAARQGADVGQHAVDHQQHPSGDHPRPDGTLHHGALLLHTPGADVHRNDNAEGQGGDGVHGLIALDEALDHRMGRVVPGGRTVALQRVDQTAHKGDDDQRHQDGAENLAQPVGELLRPQGDEQGGGEEHQGVDQLIHPDGGVRSHEGRDGHFKRGGGRPGDGQAGADGQIGHDGEHPGKGGMHTAAQGIQPAGAGHRHHPQYRQPHRAEGQPQHGGPGLGARLGRNIGRKNQITRPKKHGEQGEAHQKQIPALQPSLFLSHGRFLSRNLKTAAYRTACRCFSLTYQNQPWEMAPVGQVSAQEPQSMQEPASMT